MDTYDKYKQKPQNGSGNVCNEQFTKCRKHLKTRPGRHTHLSTNSHITLSMYQSNSCRTWVVVSTHFFVFIIYVSFVCRIQTFYLFLFVLYHISYYVYNIEYIYIVLHMIILFVCWHISPWYVAFLACPLCGIITMHYKELTLFVTQRDLEGHTLVKQRTISLETEAEQESVHASSYSLSTYYLCAT